MIIIKFFLNTIKFFSIFILIEIFIAFLIGLFGLLGMNMALSKIILLFFNMIIFFIYGFTRGKITTKKGFIEGLITGGIFVICLFVISLIFFHQAFNISMIAYYISLLFISMIGATIGKNKKIDSTSSDKK